MNNTRKRRGGFVMSAAETEPYYFYFQCVMNKSRPARMQSGRGRKLMKVLANHASRP
jgi:hypothetical protein